MRNNNEDFGNDNPNQKIFRTQEGTPYILRRAYSITPPFALPAGPHEVYLVAVFNPNDSISNWITVSPYGSILIENSTKPVVPIMFNFQVVQPGNAPAGSDPTLANLQLPYYNYQQEYSITGGNNGQQIKPMSKMNPLVEMIEASAAQKTLVYNCKYNQATLQDDDFLEVQGSAAFIFNESSANAYTSRPNTFTLENPYADTTVIIAISFLYFELQK